jgi:tetratricopeptide (TPR) repeat protein
MFKKRILLVLVVLGLCALPCFSQEEEEESPYTAINQAETPARTTADSLVFFRLLDWPRLWQNSQSALNAYYEAGVSDSSGQALLMADSALDKAAALDIRLPLQAGYLKSLSRQAVKNRDRTLAYGYSQLALKADPSYPGLVYSNFKIMQSRTGFGPALKDAWNNFKMAQKHFWYQLNVAAKCLTLASLFLLFSGLIFLLLLAAKYLPYLHHVVGDLLPKTLPARSRRLIAAGLLVSCNLVLGFISLVLPVALSAILSSIYASRREKIALVLAVVFLAAAGAGLTLGRHLFVNLSDGYLQALSQANQSGPDDGLKAKLAECQLQRPEDLTPLFCLALMEKRAGNFSRSRQYLDTLLEASGRNSKALNNLGNLLFYQGKIDSASEAYRQATQADPAAALAHYNLAQAYFKLVDFKAADQERVYALSLGKEDISSRAGFSNPGLVLDELIPPSYFWGQAWLGLNLLSGFSPAECRSLTGLNLWLPAWMGLALLFLALVVVIAFFTGPGPARCPVCYRYICPSCQVTSPQKELLCPECHQDISAATSPELQEKVTAHLNLKKTRLKTWTGAVSNLLAPGSALMLENMTALALILSLAWGAVYAALCGIQLLLLPYDLAYYILGTGPGWIIMFLMITSWLMTWVAVLKHANMLAAPSKPEKKADIPTDTGKEGKTHGR